MENKQRLKRITRWLAFAVLIFVLGGMGGVYFQQYVLPRVRANKVLSRIDFLKKTAENITVINKTEQITVKDDDSISQLAAQSSATVVEIISVAKTGAQNARNLQNKLQPVVESKIGSGIIGTSDGMLVTYRGAILEKNATYQVLLSDSSVHEAKLIGVDEFTNLAFLKIEASNLSVVTFGDSNNLPAGKKLLIVTGFQKYAAGILSSKNKTFNLGGMAISVSEKMEGVLTTDFNQSEDFQGAAVVTYGGELMGLNGSAVIDNKLVNFQIPAETIKNTLEMATNDQLNARPFFGAYYVPLTKEYALTHQLTQDKGALIYSASGKQSLAFIDGSPAEKAGLKLGDVVTAVDGQEINLDNPLANLLNLHKKGDQVELTVQRAGQELKISVML